jgi:hypothetical protein
MTARHRLAGKRDLLSDQIPFLLGRYPDRLAPVHLANGFLSAALGTGGAADDVRRFLRTTEQVELDGVSSAIRRDPSRDTLLRRALTMVLNPDRRIFPTGGSGFPLHGGLVSSNPYDDRFGRDVWRLVLAENETDRELLRDLFYPGANSILDPVSAVGFVLGRGGTAQDLNGRLDEEGHLQSWSRSGVGREFAKSLARLVLNPVVRDTARLRSDRIAALIRGVTCAAFLASLRCGALSGKSRDSWADLVPMFVVAGVPPGKQGSPEVQLASRSFEALVSELRASIAEFMRQKLASKPLPRGTPSGQKLEVLLGLTFANVSKGLRQQTQEEVRWDDDLTKLARRLMTAIYPPGHLERGYRTFGRMIGLAGPDRGSGSPRLLLETPILALLVSATTGVSERVPFADWLDRLYEQYGLIVGIGTRVDTMTILRSLASSGNVERALIANHESLRLRLVESGLAVEYSDGETEVQSGASSPTLARADG